MQKEKEKNSLSFLNKFTLVIISYKNGYYLILDKCDKISNVNIKNICNVLS